MSWRPGSSFRPTFGHSRTTSGSGWSRGFCQLYPALRRELLEEERIVELERLDQAREREKQALVPFERQRATEWDQAVAQGAYDQGAYDQGAYNRMPLGLVDLMNTTTTDTRTERPTKTPLAAAPRVVPVAPAPGRRKIRMED